MKNYKKIVSGIFFLEWLGISLLIMGAIPDNVGKAVFFYFMMSFCCLVI